MKIFIVVAAAALSAAVGETFLSYGMRRYGVIELSNVSHLLTLVLSVGKNPYVFTGVVFLAIFFFLYLAALSWADLSYVLPLTAMSYIFAALLAKFALGEDVSWQRWVGTAVIVLGISCVALDNKPRSVIEHGDTDADRSAKKSGSHDYSDISVKCTASAYREPLQ